jgi:hypothetical protein
MLPRSLATAIVLGGCASVLLAAPAPPRHVRAPRRHVVVVHPGFPIRRALPNVVVRAPRVVVKVAPRVFLPPVVWAGVVVVAPPREALAWEDGETLAQAEGWTDFTLNVDDRGRKLFLEVVDGEVRLNFAEVVFGNGDAQVVDFAENQRGPGIYSLLDFADGRMVDHVRVVALATSATARLALKMAK